MKLTIMIMLLFPNGVKEIEEGYQFLPFFSPSLFDPHEALHRGLWPGYCFPFFQSFRLTHLWRGCLSHLLAGRLAHGPTSHLTHRLFHRRGHFWRRFQPLFSFNLQQTASICHFWPGHRLGWGQLAPYLRSADSAHRGRNSGPKPGKCRIEHGLPGWFG
jgi:hypothetical protein